MMGLSEINDCNSLQSIIRDYNQILGVVLNKYVEKNDSGIKLKVDSTNKIKIITFSAVFFKLYHLLESIVEKFLSDKELMKTHEKWFSNNKDEICKGYDLCKELAVQMTADPNYHLHLGEFEYKKLLTLPRQITATKELISIKIETSSPIFSIN